MKERFAMFNQLKCIPLLVFVVVLLFGCKSPEQNAAERTARLREMYPAGTSKEAIQAKWAQTKPDISASRPSSGWNAYPNKHLGKFLSSLEAKTGQKIESMERYWGPDGLFSLARCYYYYD